MKHQNVKYVRKYKKEKTIKFVKLYAAIVVSIKITEWEKDFATDFHVEKKRFDPANTSIKTFHGKYLKQRQQLALHETNP